MATQPQKGDFSPSVSQFVHYDLPLIQPGNNIQRVLLKPCSVTYSDPTAAQVDVAISSLSTTLPMSYTLQHSWVLPDYITQQHPHRPCSHYPSPPTLPPTHAPLAGLKAEVYCHKSTPMLTQSELIFEEDSALENL